MWISHGKRNGSVVEYLGREKVRLAQQSHADYRLTALNNKERPLIVSCLCCRVGVYSAGGNEGQLHFAYYYYYLLELKLNASVRDGESHYHDQHQFPVGGLCWGLDAIKMNYQSVKVFVHRRRSSRTSTATRRGSDRKCLFLCSICTWLSYCSAILRSVLTSFTSIPLYNQLSRFSLSSSACIHSHYDWGTRSGKCEDDNSIILIIFNLLL